MGLLADILDMIELLCVAVKLLIEAVSEGLDTSEECIAIEICEVNDAVGEVEMDENVPEDDGYKLTVCSCLLTSNADIDCVCGISFEFDRICVEFGLMLNVLDLIVTELGKISCDFEGRIDKLG